MHDGVRIGALVRGRVELQLAREVGSHALHRVAHTMPQLRINLVLVVKIQHGFRMCAGIEQLHM